MDGKKVLIIGAIIVAVAGSGIWFISTNKQEKNKEVSQSSIVEEKIEEISTEELGLTLTARADRKAVKFEITNTRNIASIDYELSYLAKGDIPRGVIGHIETKTTDRKITSDWLDLGSCSRNVCKYDEGVTSVSLILKITTKDDKTLQAQKELEL